jgi:hypothetical protein
MTEKRLKNNQYKNGIKLGEYRGRKGPFSVMHGAIRTKNGRKMVANSRRKERKISVLKRKQR